MSEDLKVLVALAYDLRRKLYQVQAEGEQRITELIPPDIRDQINQVRVGTYHLVSRTQEELDCLYKEIREKVVEQGGDYQDDLVQVKYKDGEAIWDTGKLVKMANSKPEILNCRRWGQPKATIVWLKESK